MTRKLLILFALMLAPIRALAQDADGNLVDQLTQRANEVVEVLRGEREPQEVFDESFLAQVGPEQLQALTMQLTTEFGALEGIDSVTPSGGPGMAVVALRFEKAIGFGQMRIAATSPHKVTALLIRRFEPIKGTGLSVADQLQAQAGVTSMLLSRIDGSETLISRNADLPMAIGSTFKLYVLSALSHAIAQGAHRWDEVVTLDQRSFPSGQMQSWPQGTPVTLQTLATMMISISDNTATDQLIAVLGREAVEDELIASGHANPELSLPFLTTSELFRLKLGSDEALDAYVLASGPERRAMLEQLQQVPLDPAKVSEVFGNGPRFIDVEWFASAHDIARIYARLKDDPVALAILAVNVGMEREEFADWAYAGYKGGSEPGVLNFSWLLRDKAGAWWVLAMTWNDNERPVSEGLFLGLARAALAEKEGTAASGD